MHINIKIISIALVFTIASGCVPQEETIQGYVDADFIYVSSPSAGLLQSVDIKKGQFVEQNILLFSLDAEPERQQLRQAQAQARNDNARLKDMESGKRAEEISVLNAQLAQAQAAFSLAESKHKRELLQFQNGHLSALNYDQIKSELQQKQAAVAEIKQRIEAESLPAREEQYNAQSAILEMSQAKLSHAEWVLKNTAMKARQSGRVFDIYYRPGEWIPAGSPIIALLPNENIKFRFFISSSQLANIRYGKSVNITPLNSSPVTARVTYISPRAEYTPPLIYSNERKEKMVFLIEAKPDNVAQAGEILHPGMPVEITL